MPATSRPRLPVPKDWNRSVQAAFLQVIALAKYAMIYTQSWASNSSSQRVRLSAKVSQLEQEVALLREEIRIKDARMERIPAPKRPHYEPTERLAILELRAARGWSLDQTARVFQVTPATIASWGNRLDEEGPDALLATPEPVNKFPDFVRAVVRRLQTLCPRLGKVKIAQILARAGLHLGATTISRMRREEPPQTAPTDQPLQPSPHAEGDAVPPTEGLTSQTFIADRAAEATPSAKRVTAKRPNHVWLTDLTVVPTAVGFWAPWFPFALLQCFPFCWWLGVVIDAYSRRALAVTLFWRQPTSEQMRAFLGRVIARVGTAPKHLITDSGVQFTCAGFAPRVHALNPSYFS